MNIDKLEVTKKVVSFVVGAGTSKIVKGIILNNTDPESLADKATIVAATVVVGAMASEATSSFTDRKIDEVVTWWVKLKAEIEEKKKSEESK